MDVNLTTDLAPQARQLASFVEERQALLDEAEDIAYRIAGLRIQCRREIHGVLSCLDPNRPATLTLCDGTQLKGAVTFGTLSGFVHVGQGHTGFQLGAVVRVEQDDPEISNGPSPFQVVGATSFCTECGANIGPLDGGEPGRHDSPCSQYLS